MVILLLSQSRNSLYVLLLLLLSIICTSYSFAADNKNSVEKYSEGLSLEDALSIMVDNSPELRILLESKTQANIDHSLAKSALLPSARLEIEHSLQKDQLGATADLSATNKHNKFSLYLRQNIFNLSLISKISRAAHLEQANAIEGQAMLTSLLQTSVIAYFDVIAASYRVKISKEYLLSLGRIEKLVLKMRKTGSATVSDVKQVSEKLSVARSNYSRYKAEFNSAGVKLAYLLHIISANSNPAELEVSEILPKLTTSDFFMLSDKLVSLIPTDFKVLQNTVLRNNLEVLVKRADICSTIYQLEELNASKLPTLGVEGEVSSESDKEAPSTNSSYAKITFSLAYDLFDPQLKHSISKVKSTVREKEYRYDLEILNKRDTVYALYNQLNTKEYQRGTLLNQISSLEEIDRIYAQQIKFASRTLLERLENLNTLYGARLGLIENDYQVLASRMELIIMMGSLVEFFGYQNYITSSSMNLC